MGRKSKKKIIKKYEFEMALNKFCAKEGRFELVLVLDHLKAGFNIAKILRSAEVFSIKKVVIIGTKFFDPYPAKGALKRVPIEQYQTLNEAVNSLFHEGYKIYSLTLLAKKSIAQTVLNSKTAFILGHEEFGPDLEKVEKKDQIKEVRIQQFGQTESLNVSIAASIATYEYIRQLSQDEETV
jgi:tRNA G18 (ribose-2'-O)-methylase SpoU